MSDLFTLTCLNFTSLLSMNSDLRVDWELTWAAFAYNPVNDASYTSKSLNQHLTIKHQLFMDELPTLEKLKFI